MYVVWADGEGKGGWGGGVAVLFMSQVKCMSVRVV